MKAITIWQPWAELIILGFKQHETRSWATTYRGKIAIHAGKFHRLPHSVYTEIAEAIGIPPEEYAGSWLAAAEAGKGVHFGAVIGTATLTGSYSTEYLRRTLPEQEIALGDFTDGRHGWKLEKPIRIDPPIPARGGRQGLWELRP